LFGVNINNYCDKFKFTGDCVDVKDPYNNYIHNGFSICNVKINGELHTFAFGEVSNGIFAFFVQE
jgi:hypothetical protein